MIYREGIEFPDANPLTFKNIRGDYRILEILKYIQRWVVGDYISLQFPVEEDLGFRFVLKKATQLADKTWVKDGQVIEDMQFTYETKGDYNFISIKYDITLDVGIYFVEIQDSSNNIYCDSHFFGVASINDIGADTVVIEYTHTENDFGMRFDLSTGSTYMIRTEGGYRLDKQEYGFEYEDIKDQNDIGQDVYSMPHEIRTLVHSGQSNMSGVPYYMIGKYNAIYALDTLTIDNISIKKRGDKPEITNEKLPYGYFIYSIKLQNKEASFYEQLPLADGSGILLADGDDVILT